MTKLIKKFECCFVYKVHSDFILEKQPTSFDDVMKIQEELTRNLGVKENGYKYSIPVTVKLVSLKHVSISLH